MTNANNQQDTMVKAVIGTVLRAEDVDQTYNGFEGCACGCKGTYTEDGDTTSTTVKRRVALLNKNMEDVNVWHWADRSCYELSTAGGTRVTRVYVKAGTPSVVKEEAPKEKSRFKSIEVEEGDHIIIVIDGKPVGIVISTRVDNRYKSFDPTLDYKHFEFTAHGLNVGEYPTNFYISSIASGGTINPKVQSVSSVMDAISMKYLPSEVK